jgi:archaellum component FlaC
MAENTKIIISAVDKTRKGFSSVTSGLKKVSSAVFNLKTALLGVVGTAGFGLLVKNSLQSTDALAKTASKIGTTTEALSKLNFAADITGVATETMNMALQRFTRRAAEAAKGTGEAKGALKELGISARELVRLPLDQRMLVLADAFSGVENESDKLRLAFKLFDSEGAALVNTLGLGRDGLNALFKEAEDLGLVLSGTAAKGVEDANDAITRLRRLFKGVTDQTVAALAPAIALLTETFKDFLLEGITKTDGGVKDFANSLAITLLDAVGTSLEGLQNLFNGIVKFYNDTVTKINEFNEVTRRLNPFLSDDEKKNAQELGSEIEQLNAIQKERLRLIEEISQQIQDGGGIPDPLGLSDLPDVFPKMQSDLRSLRSEFDETASRIDVLKDLLEKTDNSFDTIGKKDFTSAILKQLENLKKSIGSVNEGTDDLNKNIEEKMPSAFQILIERMQELRKQGKDVSESLVDIGDKALNGLAKAFTDAITGAKKFSDAMRAMSKSVIDSLIQMLIQKYIVDAAFGAITNFINPTTPKSSTSSALSQAADAGYGIRGFDGGGYTGMGARAGGLDNKGGFAAVLHPNESIIDHSKGQSMGVTINQTINVTTGIQSTVRSELVQLLPQIAAVTRSSVADARLRGGSFSKAMVGA